MKKPLPPFVGFVTDCNITESFEEEVENLGKQEEEARLEKKKTTSFAANKDLPVEIARFQPVGADQETLLINTKSTLLREEKASFNKPSSTNNVLAESKYRDKLGTFEAKIIKQQTEIKKPNRLQINSVSNFVKGQIEHKKSSSEYVQANKFEFDQPEEVKINTKNFYKKDNFPQNSSPTNKVILPTENKGNIQYTINIIPTDENSRREMIPVISSNIFLHDQLNNNDLEEKDVIETSYRRDITRKNTGNNNFLGHDNNNNNQLNLSINNAYNIISTRRQSKNNKAASENNAESGDNEVSKFAFNKQILIEHLNNASPLKKNLTEKSVCPLEDNQVIEEHSNDGSVIEK